ncbi:hypothetical protein C3432_06565 [Citrobacter amalonaticus]|uniref:Uncharacterized protein n=2 Tax=Citrobacter amalonaticus TaxID=35703 RepID=A0A2S4RYP5_CITAM|nr:hypothetical protein C3432_06565 [Citrobacter amalonaticus]POT76857.1 hypothetical protein C3436_05255 [Citrobacter amalonaticus]POU65936.1 hypothetical protein C3430_11670 [Citrobacter amalonaticus]POV06093.1 hypothetical protein C3424_12555 [Citrobacter amalonaticus]
MFTKGVNDGAKFALLQGWLRHNGAVISYKFRRRSHFQNYIWRMNNIANFSLFPHLACENIHFLCTDSEYRWVLTP